MLFPTAYEALVPCVALVLTWLDIHAISLAARYRTAACSNTLNQGLEKIQAARAFDFAPIIAPSMARGTAEAFNIVCRLDRNGKLDEVSQDKKQKFATRPAP